MNYQEIIYIYVDFINKGKFLLHYLKIPFENKDSYNMAHG